MPLDPRVRRLLDLLEAGGRAGPGEATLAGRRDGLARLLALGARPEPVASVVDVTLRGPVAPLPLRLYTPDGVPTVGAPGLIYFHGGGLLAGSLDTHDAFARGLAVASRARVVSVGYRLAPEHRFPAALDDALWVIRHLHARATDFGLDPARLATAGDSAGATLVAAATHALATAGACPVRLQLLICPILDHRAARVALRRAVEAPLLGQELLDDDLYHYLPPGVDPADPRVSPAAETRLAGLPATLVHAAEYDVLRDEAQDYADRLARAGTRVTHVCHPGMIHLFYALGAVIPYAREALARIGADVRDGLAVGDAGSDTGTARLQGVA